MLNMLKRLQFWETSLIRSDFATFWTLHQWPQTIRSVRILGLNYLTSLEFFQVLGLYRLEPQAVACRARAPKRVSKVVFDMAFFVGKIQNTWECLTSITLILWFLWSNFFVLCFCSCLSPLSVVWTCYKARVFEQPGTTDHSSNFSSSEVY